MTSINKPTTTPLRVLVVENDPQWRADHLMNLKSWGYAAWAAEPAEDALDQFESLRKDAIDKAKHYRCHVALVDMRLKYDDDPSDTSGLDLVRDLAPTVSIIVSGYGDRKTVRDALKSPPEVPERAYDFVGKEDGPEVLREVLHEAIRNAAVEVLRSRNIQTDWRGLTPADLVAQFFPNNRTVPVDQIEDVLKRLFPNATGITLEPVKASGHVLSPIHGTSIGNVFFLVFEGHAANPKLVMLGPARSIQKTIDNYRRFVENSIFRRLTLLDTCVLWDIGAIVYDLATASREVKTLSSALHHLDVADISEIVRDLVAMLKHFKNSESDQKASHTPLFDSYLSEYQEQLRKLAQGNDTVELPNLNVRLPTPVSWVLARSDHSPVPGQPSAIGHRRLLTDNIFLDADGHIFLIDFENIGLGYVLQDVTLCEVDLFIQMTSNLNPMVLLELAVVVAQGEENRSWIRSTTRVDNNREAQKVLEIVLGFRQQAFESIYFPDRHEYLWALLLSTVKWMILNGRDDPGYERAQLFGAVLCERIASKNDVWPTTLLHGINLLSHDELEFVRSEITSLKRQLNLLRIEQHSYGKKTSPSVLQSIKDIENKLSEMGLSPDIAGVR